MKSALDERGTNLCRLYLPGLQVSTLYHRPSLAFEMVMCYMDDVAIAPPDCGWKETARYGSTAGPCKMEWLYMVIQIADAVCRG